MTIPLCQIARDHLGMMLECWLMRDVPEVSGEPEVGLIAQAPSEILTYLDQATNRQRSGLYARGIGIALAAQATVLEKQFPHFEDESWNPDPIGLGIMDENAGIKIRTVALEPQEQDPCAIQESI
jgi:hypothetical protein